MYILERGCRWFHAEATFLLRKNSRPEVYTDVHFWTGYFKRLAEKFCSLFQTSWVNASDRVDKKRRIIEAVRPFESRSEDCPKTSVFGQFP